MGLDIVRESSVPLVPPHVAAMSAQRARLIVAFVAVSFVWGTTYFAIRVALHSFPPFRMGGIRFLVAGSVLYVAMRWRGAAAPTARQWGSAAITGALLLMVGNGAITVAQRHLTSSVAAIIVATMPLWAVIFARFFGDRPTRGEAFGVVLGFTGVAVLNFGGDLAGNGLSAALASLAPMGWALGSLLSRRLPLAAGSLAMAMQMLAGGAAMMLLSVSLREHATAALSARSVSAIAYLIVFGSLIAFSAYGYLLRNTRPAIATSYAYVNPLVALAVGATLGGESVGLSTVLGAAVILAGVFLLSRARRKATHT